MADHGHGGEHHGSGPGFYLLIALILGVITFIEFAIIQWPQAWLSQTMVVVTLITLSVAKFLMVIAYFMHLRDDENTYSGFFGSGMVIAMGTFVVLTFLFTVPSVANALRGGGDADHEVVAEAGHGEEEEGHHGVPDEVLASIESDGYSRETAALFDSPRPKSQALVLTPPPVDDDVDYTLEAAPLFGSAVPEASEAPADEASPEPADDGPVAQAAAEVDLEAGLAIYNRNCVGCHQGSGAGIPGAFPPLAGHTPDLYAVEGGRNYLINVLLYGLQGPITVQGANYTGVMPAWPQLSDGDVALVLDYILNDYGNADLIESYQPYGADEIAAERGNDLSPSDVLDLRSALDLP
jgi:mono/diheme cytochrome c family protein/heme/copper-type cytochrome/quinol oxidase subunit 4